MICVNELTGKSNAWKIAYRWLQTKDDAGKKSLHLKYEVSSIYFMIRI